MQHDKQVLRQRTFLAGHFPRHAGAALLVSALAACGGRPGVAPPQPGAQPLALTILHINDHHSNLDARTKTLWLRNAANTRVQVEVDAGGFPRIAAAMRALAAENANVLKLHAGDAFTGTPYFARAGAPGEADAAMMSTVCFDAFTLGNHEFDQGDAVLGRFIDQLHAGACKTPVLSANVHAGAGSALNAGGSGGYVRPYTVVERSGQKIGLVGLTIAGKTRKSSSPDPGTLFENETTAAQRAIDALQARGVNKIVVLSHIGYLYDKALIAGLRGVDVVVGGDSHSLLGPAALATYGVGTPAGPYAETLRDANGGNVCLAQAWEYAQAVGELHVEFDAAGRVTRCGGTPQVLIGDDFRIAGAEPAAADLAAFRADVAASGFLRVTEPDARAAAVLAPYQAKVQIFKKQPVATVPAELCSRRVPGGPGSADYGRSSPACNRAGSVSLHGGDIQQMVAQAYLDVANKHYGGADISLQNGGGVRFPLKGRITAANIIEVLPFGNMLWKLEVTGVEVKSMVEDGLDGVYKAGGTTGPYPYTGGLRWDADVTQPKGRRASKLEVRNATTGTWEPLDPGRTYRLFALRFNVTGGDDYTTLANVPAERRHDVGVLDADVFQSWIDDQPRGEGGLPVLNRLPTALYSTQSFIDLK